LDMNNLHTFY